MNEKFSTRQVQHARYFAKHPMSEETIKGYDMRTILSLLNRRVLQRRGKFVGLSDYGFEVLEDLGKAHAARRKHRRAISPSVRDVLGTFQGGRVLDMVRRRAS